MALHLNIARRDQYTYRMIGFLVKYMDKVTASPWGIAAVIGLLVFFTVVGNYLLIRFFTKGITKTRIPAEVLSLVRCTPDRFTSRSSCRISMQRPRANMHGRIRLRLW